MSYILDALKKSEQERKQGQVPGLNSFQDQPRPPRTTSRILFYLLSGFLVVNALAISLWLFFRPPTPTPAESTREVITETVLTQTDQPQQLKTDSVPVAKAAETDQPNQPATRAEPDILTPTPADLGPEPETSSTAGEQATVIVPANTDSSEEGLNNIQNDSGIEIEDKRLDDIQESSAPAKPELTTFANLPADIRSALPKLVIAAHYYASKPSARMASINGRVMRQGQTVTDGLILEEIIREGVILSFHDYRFSLKVFNR
jgi:general secretion pathway protein B